MPSKIQVDQIAGATGSTVTLPSGQTLDLSSGTVNLPSASLSALNASNLTSGTVPSARLSLTSSDLPTVPTTKGGTGLTTIGTANQVLRVNSGATGLEFATPAVATSDYVKITSGSFSAVSEVNFNTSNFDGATYDSFDIVIRLKHASGSNVGGATFIQFSTDNLSSFFSSNISGNTSTFNSSTTTQTVMFHDNTDRNQISRDGNRDTFGTYILTWVGLNKATEKQCFSQAIKANHDATTRVCSETAYTHINSTTSTNNAFKLIWASGSNHSYTGTYIIYGRKS